MEFDFPLNKFSFNYLFGIIQTQHKSLLDVCVWGEEYINKAKPILSLLYFYVFSYLINLLLF